LAYIVDLVDVQAITTAVVPATIPLEQVSDRVLVLFDEVYEFLPRSGITHSGLNIILYRNQSADLEAGVQVDSPFQGSGQVICSALPAGRAAHAVHYGEYSKLGEVHRAIRDWCRERELAISGVNWEVYGHWHDIPPMLRTDVYYLLEEA
jgi:effector-binding domain-containing protein